MKHLWLFWLPLLFLPNLGAERATPFGTLTVADFLIGPYMLLVYWRSSLGQHNSRTYIDSLLPLMVAFLCWATISTLLLPFRYNYINDDRLIFGLFKLGKFSLYSLAGILTVRALSHGDDYERRAFQWSFLVSGVLVGLTLLISKNTLSGLVSSVSGNVTEELYLANAVNAMMAIMITFTTGSVLVGNGSRRWHRYALLGLIIMVLGFFMSNGRGGWVAAMIGMLYLFSRVDIKRTFFATLLGIALVIYTYMQFPSFRYQVDRTLQPDTTYLETYNAGIFGIDDGARITTWTDEALKIPGSPILGRGFFHRGGLSGIYSTGSHNFFLQMFLETGLPGGLLILAIFWRMWQHAVTQEAVHGKLKEPLRAALISAFVVGLSGEYFYGGMTLFALFLVYAPIGSIRPQITIPARYVRRSGYGARGTSVHALRSQISSVSD